MSEISPAKLEANRRNAQMSTGPTSAAGKARSSRNALKHGLTAAACTVLPDEDAAAYTAVVERLTDDLAPADEVERLLVGRIGQLFWRLHRAGRLEQALGAALLCASPGAEPLSLQDVGYSATRIVKYLALLGRYESGIERSLYRALHELERRQAARGQGDHRGHDGPAQAIA